MIVKLDDREKIRRVKVRERIQILCKYVHILNSETESARVDICADPYDRVLLGTSLNKNKVSANELKQQI